MSDLTDNSSGEDFLLLGRLGAMFDLVDPVPPGSTQTKYAVFTWRTIDTELAKLAESSPPADPAGGEPRACDS